MEATRPSRWTLFERAFMILPTILIAAVVWLVASGAEREKIRIEYVRIATAILQQPREEPDRQRIMREWAVAILNKSAPISLSKQQAEALIEGTSRLVWYRDEDWNSNGWVFEDRANSHRPKKLSPSPKPQ